MEWVLSTLSIMMFLFGVTKMIESRKGDYVSIYPLTVSLWGVSALFAIAAGVWS